MVIAADLRKRPPKPQPTWHLDEVYLKIDGRHSLGVAWAYHRRIRRADVVLAIGALYEKAKVS
jgi:transposase-like protein